MDSFHELRNFPAIKGAEDEAQFTALLRSIYMRHANVVRVCVLQRTLAPQEGTVCARVCVRAVHRCCCAMVRPTHCRRCP